MAVIEGCWNVYPPNGISSSLLLVGNSLLLIGIWSARDLSTADRADRGQGKRVRKK